MVVLRFVGGLSSCNFLEEIYCMSLVDSIASTYEFPEFLFSTTDISSGIERADTVGL